MINLESYMNMLYYYISKDYKRYRAMVDHNYKTKLYTKDASNLHDVIRAFNRRIRDMKLEEA